MFPQHLLTIFLTALSLVVGEFNTWPGAQLESQRAEVLEQEPGKAVVAASPSSTPLSGAIVPSVPQQEDGSGPTGFQMSVALPRSEVSENSGLGPSDGQETRVESDPTVTVVEYNPEALDYLSEIAFGVEYGESSQVLHKWTEDVKIKVHGTPTRDDLTTLNQVVTELNGLITDVHLRITDDDSNLNIYFLPESQFASVEPEYVPVNLGFFRVWWDGSGAIDRARVLIDSRDVTQQERSHLIREELTQSLGLFQDSWRYPDSMFYQGWTDITTYSDLDRATIRLLYSPKLTPLMTQKEALKALGADSSDLCCSD